jgi:hypothetical protein
MGLGDLYLPQALWRISGELRSAAAAARGGERPAEEVEVNARGHRSVRLGKVLTRPGIVSGSIPRDLPPEGLPSAIVSPRCDGEEGSD